MPINEDLRKLSNEEVKLKLYWNDVVEHIRRDLAYIWTDEVKKDFEEIKKEAGKITFILGKLHIHYKTNKEKYYKEISDIRNLLQHISKIKPKASWIKQIQSDLQQIIWDVEKEKRSLLVPIPEVIIDEKYERDAEILAFRDRIPTLLKEVPQKMAYCLKKVILTKAWVGPEYGHAEIESFELSYFGEEAERVFFHELAHVFHNQVDVYCYDKERKFDEEWQKIGEEQIDGQEFIEVVKREELPFSKYLAKARVCTLGWEYGRWSEIREDVATFVEVYYRPFKKFRFHYLSVPLAELINSHSKFYETLREKNEFFQKKPEILEQISNKYKRKLELLKEFGFVPN